MSQWSLTLSNSLKYDDFPLALNSRTMRRQPLIGVIVVFVAFSAPFLSSAQPQQQQQQQQQQRPQQQVYPVGNVGAFQQQQQQQQPPRFDGNSGENPPFGQNVQNQQQINRQRGFIQQGPGPVLNNISNPYNNGSWPPSQLGGVQVQFQLRDYINSGSQLPDGKTCICPVPGGCRYLSQPPRCFFQFTQPVQYIATDFYQLDTNGQVMQTPSFQQQQVLSLATKPTAIDVFVHHLGAVINRADGNLAAQETLVHVDTFQVNLDQTLPSVNGPSSVGDARQLTGQQLGTSLTLSWSISCTSGSGLGVDCDLACNRSTVNTGVAACRSQRTGYFSVCKYTSNGQVDQCERCPWGIAEQTYCRDADGGMLSPDKSGVVDASFRTWTIILGVLAALLALCVVALIIAACVRSRRERAAAKRPLPGAQDTRYRGGATAERPLLAERPDSLGGTPVGQPLPLPRGVSVTQQQPSKSSLRKPLPAQFAPPAHLGGGSSINGSVVSSTYDSNVPMRPSRSEIV